MEIPPTTIPDSQTRKRKIHCKQELVIQSLQRFYNGRDDINEIVELLKGTSDISLRLVDWFVTNYSKKLFDPFCRRERILFQIPGHEAFLTTVGKLNFFRWAIEKGILDYIK